MRSHPTLAPRPQICLIGGNGFCAVAGESELKQGRGFGDEMRELLLAREEVHWLVCLFTQPQITIFLLFAYIKVSTFQEYQNMSQSTKKQGTSIVLFPLMGVYISAFASTVAPS